MIEFEFDKEAAHPRLELTLPAAMEGTEGSRTLIALASVFEQSLHIANRKNQTYGDAWRRQGWMGNLARIMSKVSRLVNMCWRDHSLENAEESVTDTAFDQINITGFFIINRSEDNKWGTR